MILGIVVANHNFDPVVDCVTVSVVCLEIVDKTDVVVSAEVAKNYKIPLLCTLCIACVLYVVSLSVVS